MIYQEDKERSVIMMPNEIKSMAIKANAKSMMVMVDRLYTKKKEAVVREIGANAMDSHKIIGNQEPFTIIMPSELDPHITIIDNGPGLSWEDKVEYLGTIFSTSKDGEDISVGHYGLGAKSPHTVASTYSIESRHDGKLIKSVWFRDGDDMPKFMKTSEEPYEGPTGITFKIPAKADSHDAWIDAIKTQTAGMNPRPKVISLGVEVDVHADHEYITSIGDVDCYKNKRLRNFFGPIVVDMGGVLYPARGLTLNKMAFEHAIADHIWIIKVPIGAALPPPHRESLEDCPHTQKGVNKVIDEVNRLFAEMIKIDVPVVGDDPSKVMPTLLKYQTDCDNLVGAIHPIFRAPAVNILTALFNIRECMEAINSSNKYFDLTVTRYFKNNRGDFNYNELGKYNVNIVPKPIEYEAHNRTAYLNEEETKALDSGLTTIVELLAAKGQSVDGLANIVQKGTQIQFTNKGKDSSCYFGCRSPNIGAIHATSGAAITLRDKLYFYDGKELNANRRRWIHCRMISDIAEPTDADMLNLDINRVDTELSFAQSGEQVYNIAWTNHDHPSYEAVKPAILEEFRRLVTGCGIEIIDVPDHVKITKPRKKTYNMTGVRVLRNSHMERQKQDNSEEMFTLTPAWCVVPNINSFSRPKVTSHVTSDGVQTIHNRHCFVYSSDKETEVYLDPARTIKVSKAWLFDTIVKCTKTFTRTVGAFHSITVEAIRLGADTEVPGAIRSMKEGWSEELDLLGMWAKAAAYKPGKHENIFVKMYNEQVTDSNIVGGLLSLGESVMFERYNRKGNRGSSIISATLAAMKQSKQLDTMDKGQLFNDMVEAQVIMGAVQYILHELVSMYYNNEFIAIIRGDTEAAMKLLSGVTAPDALKRYWLVRATKLMNEAVLRCVIEGNKGSYTCEAVKVAHSNINKHIRETEGFSDLVKASIATTFKL